MSIDQIEQCVQETFIRNGAVASSISPDSEIFGTVFFDRMDIFAALKELEDRYDVRFDDLLADDDFKPEKLTWSIWASNKNHRVEWRNCTVQEVINFISSQV
jgi:acyl carrier protein